MSKAKLRQAAGLHGWGGRLLGCLIYALSLNLFLAGNHIAAGGLGGIAVAIAAVVPVRLSVLVLMMNIPLLILGAVFKGWKFIRNTIVCAMAYTALVEITSYLPTLTCDPLFAALCGGALYGLALALMTLGNSSIGGTEIVVRVLLCRFPRVGVGRMCLLVDGSVVALSMILSRDVEIGLFAILTLCVCSAVAERISLSSEEKDLCLIVSGLAPGALAAPLMQELHLSVTKVEGTGMYSGTDRCLLLTAFSKRQGARLKAMLDRLDPNAFFIMLPAREAWGGSFRTPFSGLRPD